MNDKYFASEWSIHFNMDSTNGFNKESCVKIAYAMITNEFRDKLDKLYEGGSALITNTLKDIDARDYIESVGRENNCVTVSFKRSEECWDLKQDDINGIVDQLFSSVISIIEKWNVCNMEPAMLYPLYRSGMRYKPDSMYYLINDVGIMYDQRRSSYNVIFHKEIYDKYVAGQKKYFRYIMSKIMKADKVAFFDNQSTVVVIDNNKGSGPTFDRADVLACAAMFAADTIINTTKLMTKGEL